MKTPLIKSKRKGSALALMLFAVVLLLVMGGALLSLGLHTRLFASKTSSEIAARCAADAGLTTAVAEMNLKLLVKPWDDSQLPQAADEPLPNCNAVYSYTITGDYQDGYVIESTGKSGLAEKIVSCSLPLQGPFEYAIFTEIGMSLKNGTSIDWFNYDPDAGPLQVGTNSIVEDTVVLTDGVTINGDVVVGEDGDPELVIKDENRASIAGDSYAMTRSRSMPPITVPEQLTLLPSGGTLSNTITLTESGKYDCIKLGNNEVIIIDGQVQLYITGDIELKNSSELQIVDELINPEASLVLFLGGNMEAKNGSAINNNSQIPDKLKIYGLDTCQSIDFMNSGVLYGAIYTPSACVTMHNAVDVYGAIVANSLVQYCSADIYYDASLKEVAIDDLIVRFIVDQWWEK